MNKKHLKILSFVFLLGLVPCLLISFTANKYETGVGVLKRMLESIEDVKTLKYSMKIAERIRGKMVNYESKVKLQVSPRKLYLNVKGPEVLWIEGQNNGKALVNPNAFPYINLSLDPYGSIMRQDQHHTIHEIGFNYLGDIISYYMHKLGEKAEKVFVYMGEDKFNGRDCYKVNIYNPDFQFVNYIVQKGEDVIKIARKLRVSEFLILENNPKISDYDDVKAGETIKVPNAYCKLCIIHIDKHFVLPISNKVFDDKGLLESYEYHNLEVNPPITPEEFTRKYKDYNF